MTKQQSNWWLEERKCNNCGKLKLITEFQKSSRCKFGYRYRCKSCVNSISRSIYNKNSEKMIMATEVYRKNNRERLNKAKRFYFHKHPEKNKARRAVRSAIESGKLNKSVCGECGDQKVQFHHTNGYEIDNWLVGIWLCHRHHQKLHKEVRELAR